MTKDLEGRVGLVTGGGRGIGRTIAESLAARGADVVVTYLHKKSVAEQTCREIEQAAGVRAFAIKAPLGDADQIDVTFDAIEDRFGRLDVFVSNAATGVIRPVAELDERAWQWTMDANARALLLGARRAVGLMPDGGSIVALSSLGAQRVLPGYAVVGASKAAIESLVRYLAVELAPGNIRVNAVSPGVVDTDALQHFPNREEMLLHAKTNTPAGRLTTTDDVARVVDFLTSEGSSMVTGQTIVIDGGMSLLA